MNQISKVRSLLNDTLPAILLTGAPNRQYATGAIIDEGMCLVTAERCDYFTDSRYTETAQKQLSGVARVTEVRADRPYTACIQAVLDDAGIARLGVEEEKLTHGAFLRLQEKLRAELMPCQQTLDGLRAVKEPWEQEIMRQAQTIADGVYTTQSVNCDTLLTTDRPNILVILLESAGEQFASAMPHLQTLKTEGVCFTRCYANSWRTDRGTLCALSGYPSLPTLSVMKIPEKSRTMPSIAATLRQQGYHTSYLYGGDINFTNMRSYLVSTGWEHIVSMDDYTLKEQHTSQWGVRDDITFQTIYNQIASARQGERHLWGDSTLSSHEPWDVPMKQLDDEVENAFYYLDDCLYRFISRLKKTPQWRDLLIVMMADHGIINGPVDQTTPLQKNHIPMLWLGGAVRQPRVVPTICNQSDLPATLLGQLRLNHDAYPFSRDVLSETYTTPVAVHNYNNAQWICDSTGHVLYDFDLQRVTINASSDADRLQRLDKAMIQLTTTDFQNRK